MAAIARVYVREGRLSVFDNHPSPQVLEALELLRGGASAANVAAATGLPPAFVDLLAEEGDTNGRLGTAEGAALRRRVPKSRGRRRAQLVFYLVLGATNLTVAVVAFVEQNATLAAIAGGVALLLILDAHRRAKRIGGRR